MVKSEERHCCPCCNGLLKVIGSRRRGYIKDNGEHVILMIRRLRCEPCRKVHHELPDILVPYKRHCSKSIEAVITGEKGLSVVADESTINRWKQWFRALADYFLGCLRSIAVRFAKDAAEERSELPGSPLQRIWSHVENGPGWLSRIVRPLVNRNYWV